MNTCARWQQICEGCEHLRFRSTEQHCYMFRAEPSDSCAQNSQLMAKAKQDGTLLTLDQVRKLDLSDA